MRPLLTGKPDRLLDEVGGLSLFSRGICDMAVRVETHQRGHVRGATRGEGPKGESAEPRKLKLKRQGAKQGVLLTDQPIGKKATI